MAYLGVLFALDEMHVGILRSFESDEERLDFVQQEIEEEFFENDPDDVYELDNAWDAIHRALTDGHVGYANGTFPLSHAIVGGEPIYWDDDYIMSLKTPEQVKEIATALKTITKEEFTRRYQEIPKGDPVFEIDDNDLEYTWGWLENLAQFYAYAGQQNKYVLFTVDQ